MTIPILRTLSIRFLLYISAALVLLALPLIIPVTGATIITIIKYL